MLKLALSSFPIMLADKAFTWGHFTPFHIATLVFTLAMIPLLWLILRRFSEKVQRMVLLVLSLWGPAAIIYNLVCSSIYEGWAPPVSYLPLHLCSITAILVVVAIATDSQFLYNAMPLFAICAFLAVMFNDFQQDYEVFSLTFLFYYLSHSLEFAIPVVLFALGRVKPHPKYIATSVGFIFGLYTLVHFCNIWLNSLELLDRSGEILTFNYMYSMTAEGNGALMFFWNLIPYPYFYLYSTLPLILIVHTAINIPWFVRRAKKKKQVAHFE